MKFQKSIGMIVLLTIIACSSLNVFRAKAEDLTVTVSASQVRLGDFFWVRCQTGSSDAKVQAHLLSETLPLQYIGGYMTGMIPVNYNTQPGDYKLTVEVSSGNEKTVKEIPITVITRDFPEDRIQVSEEMHQETLGTANLQSDTEKTGKARGDVLANQVLPMWSESFIWPVTGRRITTNFGFTRFVNDKPNGRHSGLDIASPQGTPILAVNNGRVIMAEPLHWTGNTVMIYHGMNLTTSYCHMSSMVVKPGDIVKKGDLIGYVGMTGLTTGPHLHFTVRLGETAIDPNLLLDKSLDSVSAFAPPSPAESQTK
ncbi:MAG TPA: M23 family metallopeptidase [Bacillota bacterium]|nr:M23 family metallopeptidase [Bacillota bacterium]